MKDHWNLLSSLLGTPKPIDPPEETADKSSSAEQPTERQPPSSSPTAEESSADDPSVSDVPAADSPGFAAPQPPQVTGGAAAERRGDDPGSDVLEALTAAVPPTVLPGFGAADQDREPAEPTFAAAHKASSAFGTARSADTGTPPVEAGAVPDLPPENFGESELDSAWGELAEELGVDVRAEATPPPRRATADLPAGDPPTRAKGGGDSARTPSKRGKPQRPKRNSGGFGSGLGLDLGPESFDAESFDAEPDDADRYDADPDLDADLDDELDELAEPVADLEPEASREPAVPSSRRESGPRGGARGRSRRGSAAEADWGDDEPAEDELPPRRGRRRRGQRQQLAETELGGDEESRPEPAELLDREGDSVDGDDDDAPRGRSRRRRGRRGRGRGSRDSEAARDDRSDRDRPALGESAFDDDHEDDLEVEAIRQERRGRRRGLPDREERGRAEDERGSRQAARQLQAQESDDDEDDAEPVSRRSSRHRDVPTWLETVDLLISVNLESRKKSRGNGNGRGRGSRRR